MLLLPSTYIYYRCPAPVAPENGEWECENGNNSSTCILKCDKGFRSETPGVINCIDDKFDIDPAGFTCEATSKKRSAPIGAWKCNLLPLQITDRPTDGQTGS